MRRRRSRFSVPGEPATGQPRGRVAGAPAEAELARERLAGTIDGEAGDDGDSDGGETVDRPGSQHRRLLLHRSAFAAAAPANLAGRLDRRERVHDGDGRAVRVVVVFTDHRRWLSVLRYRRHRSCRRWRLPAASSCFCHGRRGDDADVR